MRTFLLLALGAAAHAQQSALFEMHDHTCFNDVDEMVANPNKVATADQVQTVLSYLYVTPENFLSSVNQQTHLLQAVMSEDTQMFNKYVNKRQPDAVTGQEFLATYHVSDLITSDPDSARIPINLRTLVNTIYPAYIAMKSSRDINFKHLDKEELLEDIRLGDCQIKNTVKAMAARAEPKMFLKKVGPHPGFRKVWNEQIRVSSCISQVAFLLATFPYEWTRTAVFGGDGGGPLSGEIDPFEIHNAVLWHSGSAAAPATQDITDQPCKAPFFGYYGVVDQIKCCYGQNPQKASTRVGITLAGKVMCPYGCPGCSYCVAATEGFTKAWRAAGNGAVPSATCTIREGANTYPNAGHCVAGFAIADTASVPVDTFKAAYAPGGNPASMYTVNDMSSENCLPQSTAAYKGGQLDNVYDFNDNGASAWAGQIGGGGRGGK